MGDYKDTFLVQKWDHCKKHLPTMLDLREDPWHMAWFVESHSTPKQTKFEYAYINNPDVKIIVYQGLKNGYVKHDVVMKLSKNATGTSEMQIRSRPSLIQTLKKHPGLCKIGQRN